MRLFKKIFLVISLIIIVIQLITTSILINHQRKALSVESDYNMTANMSVVISQFDQAIQYFTSWGMSFSGNKDLLAYFEAQDLTDDRIINNALNVIKDIMNASELLNNVVLTPKSGIVRLDARDAFFLDGTNDQNLEYYQVLTENPNQKSVIEKPNVGAANHEPIFSIAIQMDNDGEYLGVLGLPINLHALMDDLAVSDITEEEMKILLVSSDGVVFWSTDEAYILNEAYNLEKIEKDFFNHIVATKEGSIQTKLMGIEAQIKYEYYDVFDSYVIVYKDIAPYKKSVIYTIFSSILIGIVILIISSIAVYIILKKITDPIHSLVRYSEKLAAEDFDVQINPDIIERKDEIGQLGNTYQKMVDSLNNSFAKINFSSEKYHFLANHDELTDLTNRRSFSKIVADTLKKGIMGSIIMIDIDNFKTVNDTLGHIAGDEVLKIFANVLYEFSDESMIVSRFGGDEFIIFVEDNYSEIATKDYIESLFKYFENPIVLDNIKTDIKFSVGISSFPKDSTDLGMLIRFADIALYTAKTEGKWRVKFFDQSMEKLIVHKVDIEAELKMAMKNDGFKLVYQPQVALETGRVIGYEALIRLKNSKYFPNEFIGVAEESLQIIEIGRWVVKEVIEQIAKWQEAGLGGIKVSVNFSGEQLEDKGFYNFLLEQLQVNNVDGKLLELEVTENILIHQEAYVRAFFSKIKALGVDFSIDDFGTGYSSLNYMASFPVSKIKLDRSLNIKYLNLEDATAMMHLISLIHSLNYQVVAEGIEQWEDIAILKEHKCDYIQGYYFSKPIEVDQVAENVLHQYKVDDSSSHKNT